MTRRLYTEAEEITTALGVMMTIMQREIHQAAVRIVHLVPETLLLHPSPMTERVGRVLAAVENLIETLVHLTQRAWISVTISMKILHFTSKPIVKRYINAILS